MQQLAHLSWPMRPGSPLSQDHSPHATVHPAEPVASPRARYPAQGTLPLGLPSPALMTGVVLGEGEDRGQVAFKGVRAAAGGSMSSPRPYHRIAARRS